MPSYTLRGSLEQLLKHWAMNVRGANYEKVKREMLLMLDTESQREVHDDYLYRRNFRLESDEDVLQYFANLKMNWEKLLAHRLDENRMQLWFER